MLQLQFAGRRSHSVMHPVGTQAPVLGKSHLDLIIFASVISLSVR